MNKTKDCEECDQQQDLMGSNLKDRVWNAYLGEKKILINCDIDDSLIEKAVMQIFSFNQYDKAQLPANPSYVPEPIFVFLNSGGGLLDEAFSLISAIEASRTPVVTVALGKCASAAFLILLSGHARFGQQFTQYMYHQGSAGIGGEFSRMIEYAKHWEFCQGVVEDYVIKKTKIKRKKLNEIFHGKQDWYLGTKEAMELGIIDGIWQY